MVRYNSEKILIRINKNIDKFCEKEQSRDQILVNVSVR